MSPIAALLVSVSLAAAPATRATPVGGAVERDGLRMTFFVSRLEYQAWECIPITVVLKNVGRERIVVFPYRAVLDLGGAKVNDVDAMRMRWEWSEPQALGPGEEHLHDIVIPGRGERAALAAPEAKTLAGGYVVDELPQFPADFKAPAGTVWKGSMDAPAIQFRILPSSKTYLALVPLLEDAMYDKPTLGASLAALGPDAETELLTMFRDRHHTRKASVAHCLGLQRSRAAVPDLMAYKAEGDIAPVAVVRALGDIGDTRASAHLCQVVQKQAAGDVTKRMAMRALRTCGRPDAAPIIRRYASDPDVELSGHALAALQIITGVDQATPLLPGMFSNDEKVRDPALWRLIHMGDEATEALLAAFRTTRDPNHKSKYGHLLMLNLDTSRRRERILTAYRETMRDTDPAMRRLVPYFLTDSDRPEIAEILMALLKDSDSGVRVEAASILGRNRHKPAAAVEPLLTLMRRRPADKGTEAAISALLKYADPTLEDALTAEYPKGDYAFKCQVVIALCSWGTPRVLPWLRELATTDRDAQGDGKEAKYLRGWIMSAIQHIEKRGSAN